MEQELIEQLAAQLSAATQSITWREFRGWPDDADAALVDTVLSTRSRYTTTVLPRVHAWIDSPLRPAGRGLQAIVAAGPDVLATVLNTRQFVPGRSRKRLTKIAAIVDVATRLSTDEHRLNTADDLRAAAHADCAGLRHLIQQTRGVGPAQSSYFLMLLGVQGVKADTLVTSFVARHVESPRPLGSHDIEAIVAATARRLGRTPIELDHAIWAKESEARARRPTASSS